MSVLGHRITKSTLNDGDSRHSRKISKTWRCQAEDLRSRVFKLNYYLAINGAGRGSELGRLRTSGKVRHAINAIGQSRICASLIVSGMMISPCVSFWKKERKKEKVLNLLRSKRIYKNNRMINIITARVMNRINIHTSFFIFFAFYALPYLRRISRCHAFMMTFFHIFSCVV